MKLLAPTIVKGGKLMTKDMSMECKSTMEVHFTVMNKLDLL